MAAAVIALLVCTLQWRTLAWAESRCSGAPLFEPDGDVRRLWRDVGSNVTLNCTARLPWDQKEKPCDTTLRWMKDGQPLDNHTHLSLSSSRTPAGDQLWVSSVLVISLKELQDFGIYSCTVRNASADFCIHTSAGPNHTAAVIAAVVLILLLATAALVYSRCHLNIKLWFHNTYGDYEINDGKLYDAYVSYVNNEYDRKFVNFILKPHLETKHAYKVHLNENDILPGAEPAAELLMNISRSRRLIVLLSHAYLEQDWCTNNFRQGLLHLIELCRHPIIFITLEGQSKRMRPEVKQQLSEHQHRLTVLTWKHNSVRPSSVFWRELALAMPRRVVFHREPGDPQTVLQDDKDPMLTLDPDYLDCRADTDPAGDLGVRVPVYKAMSSRAPVLPAVEARPADIDVSDLGLRNYGARSDFYCLVTKEDM
ncbi:single Ig IL-1-related receptor [Nelusetta ayraudi]|uniref:single Ig IL-1-related receptor n=1 Tax=Nelusetta ayraudi TaxID=303726 RepID=UPI003F70F5CE